MTTTTTRFLRPTGPATWDVYLDGERVGTVARRADGTFRGLTRTGKIPMPDGSVLATDDRLRLQSWEKRAEPRHLTPQDAAKLVVVAIETARALDAQYDYQRASGWSTD